MARKKIAQREESSDGEAGEASDGCDASDAEEFEGDESEDNYESGVVESMYGTEIADLSTYAEKGLKPGEVICKGRIIGEPEKKGYFDKAAIMDKIKDLEYKVPEGAKRIPWVDTLAIDTTRELDKDLDRKSGHKLECAFHSLAMEATREAYRRLRVMKVPCTRPTDFYAEMLKTDKQMYNIRQFASEELRRIGVVENRKKAIAAKKWQKKAKTKKGQERAKEKNNTLDQIAKWTAKRKASGTGGKGASEQDLEDILEGRVRPGKSDDSRGVKRKSNNQMKSEMWGTGGKKRFSKSNTRDSLDDDDGKGKGKGKKGKGKGKGKGAKRRK